MTDLAEILWRHLAPAGGLENLGSDRCSWPDQH